MRVIAFRGESGRETGGKYLPARRTAPSRFLRPPGKFVIQPRVFSQSRPN
jgi:hypothetical protein